MADIHFAPTGELLTNQVMYQKMARAVNPYGDGHASERIVKILQQWWESQSSRKLLYSFLCSRYHKVGSEKMYGNNRD